jgi:hypothetical protein
MILRRRIVAAAALFAVAWASLWPLVTSAHAVLAGDGMTLCHGAGTMVAPDAVPRPMESAPAQDGKVHCPLCIMAFYAAHAEPPAVPEAPLTRLAARSRRRAPAAPARLPLAGSPEPRPARRRPLRLTFRFLAADGARGLVATSKE